LEIEPKLNVALLSKVRDLIMLETNPKFRNQLFSFAIPIASKHFAREIIESIFTEANMADIKWEELPFIGDTIKAKKQEARQETLQEVLIEILSTQFGKIPQTTIRAIQSIQEPRMLKTITRKSLKAESLAEVQKLLVASKTKTNGRNGSASQRKK
jgi:hypothetical protein